MNVSRSRPSASSCSHAGLVNRRLAGAQALELRLVDVEADDVVAGLREAGRRHEPDVADADDAEPLWCHVSRPASRISAGARRAGARLFAIAIIVSGESLSSSELSIQTTTPPAALQGSPP